MNRDQMVVVEFLAKHEDDASVRFEFGPCTGEEGNALCSLLLTKYKEHEGDLIQKLSGIMNHDTRSWVNSATSGFYAEVVPAYSYDLDITQATELLGP